MSLTGILQEDFQIVLSREIAKSFASKIKNVKDVCFSSAQPFLVGDLAEFATNR